MSASAIFSIGICRRPASAFTPAGTFGSSNSSSKSIDTMSSVIASTLPMLAPTFVALISRSTLVVPGSPPAAIETAPEVMPLASPSWRRLNELRSAAPSSGASPPGVPAPPGAEGSPPIIFWIAAKRSWGIAAAALRAAACSSLSSSS